ncbi:hypothetical protein EBO15_00475 [Actinomadura harenae]|uniref:Uncharacterized protein n=1 Tax=Actinomadura harenae TaxID=2483351 RepID=A0A3M2MK86_9ACTN|nr:hypothetical protein EBO15_00475 [Actinomadura harenae]
METIDVVRLAELRRDFPTWGILYIPWIGRWVAVRGRSRTLAAANPGELRRHLLSQSGEVDR